MHLFCREVTHRQLSLGKYYWVLCFGASVWVDVRDCNAFLNSASLDCKCFGVDALHS